MDTTLGEDGIYDARFGGTGMLWRRASNDARLSEKTSAREYLDLWAFK